MRYRRAVTSSAIAALQRPPQISFESVEAFWKWHAQNDHFALPIDRAISGGGGADRIGYAFVAGYAAALHALLPSLGVRTLASLAATEEQGAHPKAIQTTLTSELKLRGKKAWVTLAGERLLVLARAGEASDGRAVLRLVQIDRARKGVRVVPLPQTPFVPEVSHAEVYFEDVVVKDGEILPGDGWNDWVKPFRTVEDIHVYAAVLAHLFAQATRFGWPRELRERIAATLLSLRSLAAEPPSAVHVHVALAGCFTHARQIVTDMDPLWASAPADVRERWERDRALLNVASKAREARRLKAWELVETQT